MVLGRVLGRVLGKVLRRVLRRGPAMCFAPKKGFTVQKGFSEGVLRRGCLERLLGEYNPIEVRPNVN